MSVGAAQPADYQYRLQRLAEIEDQRVEAVREYEAREADLTRFDDECQRAKSQQS